MITKFIGHEKKEKKKEKGSRTINILLQKINNFFCLT